MHALILMEALDGARTWMGRPHEFELLYYHLGGHISITSLISDERAHLPIHGASSMKVAFSLLKHFLGSYST